jgi:hypothetical protein
MVSNSGNVGIGTTTPSSKLQVNGSALFGSSGNTSGTILFANSSNAFTTTLQGSSTQASSLTFTLPNTNGTAGQFLKTDGAGFMSWGSPAGAGTVTSVDMSVPTGLSVSGNPITGAGTLALSLTSGYVIPLTASTTEWSAKQPAGAYLITVATSSPISGAGTAASPIACPTCLTAAVTSLNGLTGASQTFATNTIATGLTQTITSSGSVHTWNLSLTSGYGIPLTASTTNWNNFFNQPSTQITAGSNLVWSGNTLAATSSPTFTGTLTVSGTTSLATTTITGTLNVTATSTLATTTISGINVVGKFDKSFSLASSTPDYLGNSYSTATFTVPSLLNPSFPVTLIKLYCKTNTGTVLLNFGGNLLSCTSGGASSTPSTNFAVEADLPVSLGSGASSPANVTVTATFRAQ